MTTKTEAANPRARKGGNSIAADQLRSFVERIETPDLTEAEAAQNARDGYALAVATKRIEALEAENAEIRRQYAHAFAITQNAFRLLLAHGETVDSLTEKLKP